MRGLESEAPASTYGLHDGGRFHCSSLHDGGGYTATTSAALCCVPWTVLHIGFIPRKELADFERPRVILQARSVERRRLPDISQSADDPYQAQLVPSQRKRLRVLSKHCSLYASDGERANVRLQGGCVLDMGVDECEAVRLYNQDQRR